MMKSEKFFEIYNQYKSISKKSLTERVIRGIKRHIRQTEYFCLAQNGSYVKVIASVTGKGTSAVTSYLSSYEDKGVYQYKLPIEYLCKLSEVFNVSVEYFLGLTDVDKQTSTAQEYMELLNKYKCVKKSVVADNVRLFKGVNGISTNDDIAKLLDISTNTVKANISHGKRVTKNIFTIEQLYKLADGFEIGIERLFQDTNDVENGFAFKA